MATTTSGHHISTTVVLNLSILLLLLSAINIAIVTAVRETELNVVLGVLRARGYHLFANAIATSDVRYDIKSNCNYTLFAPINSALFALDMTMAASNYVSVLRYHVVPRRMSIADLLSLPHGSNSLPTLVSGQDVPVEQRRSTRSLITVGGVDVVVPGMFYGRDIAVHGLGGILELRSRLTGASSLSKSNRSGNNLTLQSPISDLPNNDSNRTSMNSNSTGNNTVQIPVAILPPPAVVNSTGNDSVEITRPNLQLQPPQSSNLTQNQTDTYVGIAPAVSYVDRLHGIDMNLDPIPSPNLAPTYSAFFVQSRGEHRARAKLLELNSDQPATEPAGNGLQQFTPVDEKAVDCLLADQKDAAIHARKLYIASSTMVCAQK